MRTTIGHGIDAAETAGGTIVIIDVFRASNTILMLLARGASSVIPVKKIKEAFDLRKAHPECLLAGERKGITIDGFDMGNSPHEASIMNLVGKDIILTTSGGTQATWHARNAERVLIGSFGNARALVGALRESDSPLVTWLAVGTEGVSRAIEDDLCAQYLKGIAEGKPQNFNAMIKEIMDGEGAARLRRLGQEDDFSYCLATDLFDFVPELSKRDSLNAFVNGQKL